MAKLFLSRGESPVRVNEYKLQLKERQAPVVKGESGSHIFKIKLYKIYHNLRELIFIHFDTV